MKYFGRDREELWAEAEAGCNNARGKIVEYLKDYANNNKGDPDALMELARKGWLHARTIVRRGYLMGWYGFPEDLEELKRIIKNGWKR